MTLVHTPHSEPEIPQQWIDDGHCRTCKHWFRKRKRGTAGQCRLDAPQLLPPSLTAPTGLVWPTVFADDGCEEHELVEVTA